MSQKVIVLGAGFSGLSAAAYMAKQGFLVEILEKNATSGGRARKFEHDGFTFDMGPSWYWMPEVFENFYTDFNHTTSDFYELKRLDPGYKIFFSENDSISIPAGEQELFELFESIEKGSSKKLKRFLKDAENKYQVAFGKVLDKPSYSIFEYFQLGLITGLLTTKSFRSVSSYIRSLFKDKRLIRLLEFPVLFLGALPKNIPALYTLMNYADLKLGTWYPMGGMWKIAEAMEKICYEQGVEITHNVKVDQLDILKNRVNGAHAGHRNFYGEHFVSSADYHHTEHDLLRSEFRNYKEKYWNKRVLAPSALLFYIGIDKKLPELEHHNLFFDTDFEQHANEIYKHPIWPDAPALYISCASKTDTSIAPEGFENLVVLIPVAPGLDDTGKVREYYYDLVIKRIEKITKEAIRERVVFHKSYAHSDFENDYHSYKGNAYGLANTLGQTAFLKPKMRNKKVENLFYTGQLTVPGPGVPPSILSGKIVANEVFKASGWNKG